MSRGPLIVIAIVVVAAALIGLVYLNNPKPVEVTDGGGTVVGDAGSGSAATGDGGSGEPIKIGAILPLTGPAATYGQYAQRGLKLSLQTAGTNSESGTVPLEIIYEDSKADPKESVAVARRLIDINKVSVILTLTAGDTEAIIPICEEEGVVLITWTVSPGIADRGDLVFRNAANLGNDAKSMVHFAYNELGIRSMAVMGLTVDAHLKIEDIIDEEFTGLGGRITTIDNAERGETDFRAALLKVKQDNPDAIYVLGYIEVAYVMKQAHELGIQCQFLGDPSMESAQVIEVAGEAAENAIYIKAAFDPNKAEGDNKAFVDTYEDEFGEQPEVFAAQAYDTAMILIGITSGNSNIDSVWIRDRLLTVKNYPGVSGITTILPNGDTLKPTEFKTIKSGKFTAFGEDS